MQYVFLLSKYSYLKQAFETPILRAITKISVFVFGMIGSLRTWDLPDDPSSVTLWNLFLKEQVPVN